LQKLQDFARILQKFCQYILATDVKIVQNLAPQCTGQIMYMVLEESFNVRARILHILQDLAVIARSWEDI
jgi:hypothetical protein